MASAQTRHLLSAFTARSASATHFELTETPPPIIRDDNTHAHTGKRRFFSVNSHNRNSFRSNSRILSVDPSVISSILNVSLSNLCCRHGGSVGAVLVGVRTLLVDGGAGTDAAGGTECWHHSPRHLLPALRRPGW